MSETLAHPSHESTDPRDYLCSCRNISKEYHDRVILDGVDFDVAVGEVTVVIGKSGSGKSTLLRVIAGLEEPEEGEMTIDGKLVIEDGERTDDWSHGEKQVGMIFQSYTLWPHMDVLANLTLAPRKILGLSAGEARDRAELALSEVGMAHHIRSRSTQLSGGERQRAAIARALVSHPSCLLADEPTGNLDSHTAGVVFDLLIERVRMQQASLVLVTHDQQLAGRADRVLRLNDGALFA